MVAAAVLLLDISRNSSSRQNLSLPRYRSRRCRREICVCSKPRCICMGMMNWWKLRRQWWWWEQWPRFLRSTLQVTHVRVFAHLPGPTPRYFSPPLYIQQECADLWATRRLGERRLGEKLGRLGDKSGTFRRKLLDYWATREQSSQFIAYLFIYFSFIFTGVTAVRDRYYSIHGTWCYAVLLFSLLTVCTVEQHCCKGRSKKYRKWPFSGRCRRETP